MAHISLGRTVPGGDLTTVYDDTSKFSLLERVRDEAGNEYIFLEGVLNTAAGNWVSFDGDGATTLLAGNAIGPVGVAMAAIGADSYGFYQIYGYNATTSSDTTAANSALFIDGTAGRVDDAAVAGDLIVGANSVAADKSNVLPVWLNYPVVTDHLGTAG